MSFDRPSRRESWLVSGAVAVLFATVLLAAAMAAAVLGVRFGLVPGPALNLKFGDFAIMAQTNAVPDCNPLQPTCPAQAPPSGPRYYSLWVVTPQKVASSGNAPEQYGGARLFALQAGP